MNITELWEYLSLQRAMFTDKYVGIIAINNKFYNIEIRDGGMWMHYPSWASTIKSINDLGNVKFPIELHMGDLPPFECIMDLYKAVETQERLGQWFYNKYGGKVVCTTRLYEAVSNKYALEKIYEEYYTV